MAKCHPFNFEGGEELSHMGATWFVSYAYYYHVNILHLSWKHAKTFVFRRNIFNRTSQYHHSWLHHVLVMENSRLNTNSLGISAIEVKRMANEILEKLSQEPQKKPKFTEDVPIINDPFPGRPLDPFDTLSGKKIILFFKESKKQYGGTIIGSDANRVRIRLDHGGIYDYNRHENKDYCIRALPSPKKI